MINYSIAKRSVTVTNDDEGYKEKVEKWYPTVQTKGTVTISEFADMLAAASGHYQSSQVLALVSIIATQLVLQAKDSRRVVLGNIGTFGPALSSEGVLNAEDFNAGRDVKKVYLNWTKGSKFSKLSDAKFNLVPTIQIQKAGTKATKKASNVVNVNPEN